MRRLEITAVVVGIASAAFVLAGAVTTAPQPPAEPRPTPAALPRPASPADTVVEVLVPPPSPPVVADLPSAIADVLAEEGHTELLPQSLLAEELPPNVVGVLMAHDAVLRIPEDEATSP